MKRNLNAFKNKLHEVVESAKKDYPNPKDVPTEVRQILRDIQSMGQVVLKEHEGLIGKPANKEPEPTNPDPMTNKSPGPSKIEGIEARMPAHSSTFPTYMHEFEMWTENLVKQNGYEGIAECIGGGWDEDNKCFAITYKVVGVGTQNREGTTT